MGQEYAKAVEHAKDTQHFEITNTDLADVPYPALKALKKVNLHTICLSDNKIISISKPLKITSFSHSLTKLDLSSNGLREIPSALSELTQLTYLSLSFNSIDKIPEETPSKLTNLETLILYNNRIRTLPESFNRLQNLKVCTVNANYLDISNFTPALLEYFELSTKSVFIPKIAGLNDQHVPSLICDKLYLGCYRSAEHLEEMQLRGVTHVLTVAGGLQPRHTEVLQYKLVNVEDYEGEDLKRYFEELVDWINQTIQSGGTVLVHCAAGVSRSASIVIAYLMRTNGWKYKRAFKFAFKRRPCISPNPGFEKQLKQYDKELRARRETTDD